MKLLLLIDSLFPGGAARSLAAVAPHLVSAGVSLDFAYLVDRPGLQAELRSLGASLFKVDGSSRPGRVRSARLLLRRLRPDLVHTTLFESDITGRTAAALSHIPVVSSIVNEAYGREQLADPRIRRGRLELARLTDRATARAVVRFHAISQAVAATMGRRLHIGPDRIEVVPRGRDPVALGDRTAHRRRQARINIGAGPDDIVILAAARQEFQKGLDILLDAFPHVLGACPEARLVLSGREGASSDQLRAKAKGAGPRVQMLGARDDVADLMCAADVFVLPSRWEGFGGVLLEAMALEAPIVASDLPAIREVLEGDRCGRVVSPGRPRELAAAIVTAVRDRGRTMARVDLARKRFLSTYTVDRVADQMLAFYERALVDAGRPFGFAA